MNKKNFQNRFFIIFFSVLYLNTIEISAKDKILLLRPFGETKISLTEYFSIYEDKSRTLTITDLQKQDVNALFKQSDSNSMTLNYSYTRSAFWLRFTIKNESDIPLKRMFEIGYASLGNVQFYQPISEKNYFIISTGTTVPFSTRSYSNRNFVFTLNIPKYSEETYFLRLESTTPILIPARIWEPQEFHTNERTDYMGQAWYFGIATAMVIFNFLLFMALRDIAYLLYVAFVTCFAIAIAAEKGLAKEFLWPDATLWSDISIYVGYSTAISVGLIFMRLMLNTKRVIHKIDRFIKGLIGILLFTNIGFFYSLQTFAKPAVLLYTISVLLILGVGLFCIFKGQRSAYYFVAAFTALCLGGFVTGLSLLDIIPSNIFTINAMQFGSTAEMLLLAFALADRFNMIRREKEKAQKEALEAQQNLVENLKTSERLLEERVNLRTFELSESNAALSATNLELVEKKIQLERLSITDPLTNLYNRLMLDRVFEDELNRSKRYSSIFSIVLLDVDKFKNVNDTYGHPVGDKVLIEIAKLLQNRTRDVDVVGRWGGEEFLIICRDTGIDGARALAEKLRRNILEFDFPVVGTKTSSFGVTGVKKDDTIIKMMARVDSALYRAKESGRNIVECAI